METKSRTKTYLSSFIKVALGAGAVVGGAYVFSRVKEKQDTEVRLERMEQILDDIEKKEVAE
jgi:hemerythrin superfamily protein